MRVFLAGRYLFSLGLEVNAWRLLRATTLMLAGFVATPFTAIALRGLTDAMLTHHARSVVEYALATAALLVAQLMCGHFAHLDYFEVAELQQNRLRGELMNLVNGQPGVAHLDRADFADTAGLVRDGLFGTTKALEAVLQLAGLCVQTAITAAILIDLSPWFAFLPLCAVVPVLCERTAQSVVESARERTAERLRLNKHFIEIATSAGSVKELRLFGAERELISRHGRNWDDVTAVMWRAQLRGAVWRALGQSFFALGYGGAVAVELAGAAHRHVSVGDVILVIALAVQLSVQVSGALGLLTLLQMASKTVDHIRRLRELGERGAPRDLGGRGAPRPAVAAVPARLRRGLTLENVSFGYPESAEPVLSGLCLDIPAGATLALVGENGAGKSTLVKLLCGLYQPSGGRILADGTDLADMDPAQWQARIATLFQDFSRIELTLAESIGHGDISRVRDTAAVRSALAAAHAQHLPSIVPNGLAGYLGRSYEPGTDLSGGQWQTVGLARTLMRRDPLLLILDEPAAALDPAAEHALFERYASSARQAGTASGGVTVVVSHRFSTVRMADLIAVLEHGRLAEYGSHDELMGAGGLYAELFGLQARAYA